MPTEKQILVFKRQKWPLEAKDQEYPLFGKGNNWYNDGGNFLSELPIEICKAQEAMDSVQIPRLSPLSGGLYFNKNALRIGYNCTDVVAVFIRRRGIYQNISQKKLLKNS